MKKLLYIVALSLVAEGCINKVPVDFGEVEPQLVLNAQLNAEKSAQVIYLSKSTLVSLDPLYGADVTVYVDGKPFATAVEEELTDMSDVAAPYSFQGEFPAGSQVKVAVKKDSWDAWAQADVLPRPVIDAVDTLRTIERDMDYSYEVFQVKISFKDLPDVSYYRVGVRIESVVTQVDAAGETLEIPVVFELPMKGYNDPVLGGATAGLSFFDIEKPFLVFSDEMFRDQDYTLRLSVDSEQLYPYYYSWEEGFEPVYSYVSSTLIPWMESVTREEFDYINAVNNMEYFGYTSQIIVEPTTLPTNVNGGLGFMAVRNRTEAAPIELPVGSYEYYMDTDSY